MEVLLKIGPYAGEIRDVRAINARGLIERGEAIDPNMPLAAGGEVQSQPALVGERGGEAILPSAVAKKLRSAASGRGHS